MILRLLNPQGLAGLAASLILALLLLAAKIDGRHWRKQAAQFEQLYRGEARAHGATVANYRAAADRARAADRANAARVEAAQRSINERTAYDFEIRLAAARVRAGGLRPSAQARADLGLGGAADLSRLSPAARGLAQTAGEDRLPDPDRLTATEQAIQLDELIKWVRAQSAVAPDLASPDN